MLPRAVRADRAGHNFQNESILVRVGTGHQF